MALIVEIDKEQKKKRKKTVSHCERERNRWLLVWYDLAVFLCCAVIILALHPSQNIDIPLNSGLFNVVLAGLLVFGARFSLRVYRQIWRINQMRSFARLLTADLISGGVYLLIVVFILRMRNTRLQIPISLSVMMVFVNLTAAVVMRIVYYYLYLWGTKDTSAGHFLRNVIRVIGLVDFDSHETGGVLQLVLEPATRANEPINEMQRVVRQFAIRGETVDITQMNKGYINRTYRVKTLSDVGHYHMYTLQRINTNVFTDVDALMSNFVQVTEHLHGKLKLEGRRDRGCVQMMRPAKDGKSYLRDDSGYWRMMTHFDHVYSLDIPDNTETFYQAGRAFGLFIREMGDYDINRINTVIPNFHNTWSRYLDLEKAIEEDPVGRVKEVQPEIDFIRAHKHLFPLIAERLENGELPLRICHNDCNLNNLLFDEETHLPVAIIDLDTVMPSTPLYDFGDSMRIGTNTATDDEKDLSKVSCSLEMYEAYARGYLEACGDMLTQAELDMLPYSSLVITSEDGIRFLMDHINGDTYYNIFYPGQNLDRARTQLALVKDMERKLPQIKQILEKIYASLGIGKREEKGTGEG